MPACTQEDTPVRPGDVLVIKHPYWYLGANLWYKAFYEVMGIEPFRQPASSALSRAGDVHIVTVLSEQYHDRPTGIRYVLAWFPQVNAPGMLITSNLPPARREGNVRYYVG